MISPGKQAAKITNFTGYCLAHAAAKYGIAIHASVWMSNHHHTDLTDLTDPDGNLVPFKQLLHSTVARGLNVLGGRNGRVAQRGCDPPRIWDAVCCPDASSAADSQCSPSGEAVAGEDLSERRGDTPRPPVAAT
ncbi:MAG: hypothetical protein R6X02_14475 [Enhygromyxa sp.]